MDCPLCGDTAAEPFVRWRDRDYLRCRHCQLIWLTPEQRPSAAAEREHYTTHENDQRDQGYRRFLARLTEHLIPQLSANASGLDYGCGPGPALAAMLREAGFTMQVWDPLFAPDPTPLQQQYDFITCTETAEHFHHPKTEFERLNTLLRPGGLLGLMTSFPPPAEDFPGWHYVRDPTHVCFYSPETLKWIAERYGWEMQIPVKNVAIFRKVGRLDAAQP